MRMEEWLAERGLLWKNGDGFYDTKQPKNLDENIRLRVKQNRIQAGEKEKTTHYLFNQDGFIRIKDAKKFEAAIGMETSMSCLPEEIITYFFTIAHTRITQNEGLELVVRSYEISEQLKKRGDESIEILVPEYRLERAFNPDQAEKDLLPKMMRTLKKMVEEANEKMHHLSEELENLVEKEINEIEQTRAVW